MAGEVVYAYSQARYRKDKHELDKQIEKAKVLIDKNEMGRRAKFIKKSDQTDKLYVFDEASKQ